MLKQLVFQYPVTSLVLAFLLLGCLVWGLIYWLSIRPRDLKILALEKDITRFRNGFIKVSERERRNQKNDSSTDMDARTASSLELSESDQGSLQAKRSNNKLNLLVLNDLQKLLQIWNDKSLTNLQKTHFEETYIGQKVVWKVQVLSIADEKDDKIRVTIIPPAHKLNIDSAQAMFDSRLRDDLLYIKKGEVVTISGTIERFFISPFLANCHLHAD